MRTDANFRCESLSKSFDGVQALVDFHFVFPSTGIVAIIGPNGAGKTTLINILTGFVRPDAGRAFIDEQEITRLAPHRIARLGVSRTFQDLRLVFQVPALENVMLARPRQRGEKILWAVLRTRATAEETRNREQAMRLLEFVGLREKTAQLACELSYGEQKLLTLACCLATEASTLLLDEPVAGVHPEMASRILELLGKLREAGKLILFIEHDIAAVRKVADTVIVMDEGRIIAHGVPADVLQRAEIMEAYLG